MARADEVERAWEVNGPIAAHWDRVDTRPPAPVKPGGWGPEGADRFLTRRGREWLNPCGVHHEHLSAKGEA